MRPDSYPALAPVATPVLENIGLADSGVRLLQINGAMYLFYLDNQGRLVIHSMADGSDHYVTDGEQKIYSFDVTAQTCRDEFATVITDAYRGQEMVLIAFASATGFTEKRSLGTTAKPIPSAFRTIRMSLRSCACCGAANPCGIFPSCSGDKALILSLLFCLEKNE